MTNETILGYLKELAGLLPTEQQFEIVLLAGAAGMLTGLFEPTRTTTDCDVINYIPAESQQTIIDAAVNIAQHHDLPENWFNSQAMDLDILPDEWHVYVFS